MGVGVWPKECAPAFGPACGLGGVAPPSRGVVGGPPPDCGEWSVPAVFAGRWTMRAFGRLFARAGAVRGRPGFSRWVRDLVCPEVCGTKIWAVVRSPGFEGGRQEVWCGQRGFSPWRGPVPSGRAASESSTARHFGTEKKIGNHQVDKTIGKRRPTGWPRQAPSPGGIPAEVWWRRRSDLAAPRKPFRRGRGSHGSGRKTRPAGSARGVL